MCWYRSLQFLSFPLDEALQEHRSPVKRIWCREVWHGGTQHLSLLIFLSIRCSGTVGAYLSTHVCDTYGSLRA